MIIYKFRACFDNPFDKNPRKALEELFELSKPSKVSKKNCEYESVKRGLSAFLSLMCQAS